MAEAIRKNSNTGEYPRTTHTGANTDTSRRSRRVIDHSNTVATKDQGGRGIKVNPREGNIAQQRRHKNTLKRRTSEQTDTSDDDKNQHIIQKRLPKYLRRVVHTKGTKKIKVLKKRIRIARRVPGLVTMLTVPLIIQFIAAMTAIIASAMESISWLSYAVPGEFIFKLSWMIVVVFAGITMGATLIRFIDQFYKKNVAILFLAFLMLSWTPYFFIVPWPLVWVLYIIKIQK